MPELGRFARVLYVPRSPSLRLLNEELRARPPEEGEVESRVLTHIARQKEKVYELLAPVRGSLQMPTVLDD